MCYTVPVKTESPRKLLDEAKRELYETKGGVF